MSKKDEWQNLIDARKVAEYWMNRYIQAEERLEQYEWISVKDRLPDEDTWVLVYSKQGSYMNLKVDYIHDGRWFNSLLVTHWMPLPTLPESEDNAE